MESDHACYKRSYLLLSLAIAPFLTNFVVTALNIALPSMALDLNIGAVTLVWIPTSYLITITMFLIPSGKLGDIYGRKRLFNLGLIIFTLGSFMTVFSYNYHFIIVSRIFQGIGSAMIFSNLYAMIASRFTQQDRIRALSLIFGSIFLGSVLGPIIGGLLIYLYSWRSIFVLCTFIGILGSIAVSRLDLEWFGFKGERFDLWGSIIFGISSLMIIYGLSRINHGLNWILILLGVIGFFVFFIYEKRIETPLFNLELIHNKDFILNNAGTLLEFAPSVPIVFILSIYLQELRGVTPLLVGIILVLQPMAMLFVSVFSGKLNKSINARSMVIIAISVCLLSIFVFLTLDLYTPIPVIILGLILSGIGSSLFASPNSHLIMNSVDKTHYGVASASITTMRGFGGSLGMSLVLVIITICMGNSDINQFNYQSFINSSKIIFTTMGIVYIAGIVISLANVAVPFKNKNKILKKI